MEHLLRLTGIRFFAACLVLLNHLSINGEGPLGTLARHGFVGVSIFFSLSGFVISYSYRDRLTTGTVGTGQFLATRAARLFPIHWTVGIIIVAALPHLYSLEHLSTLAFISNGALLQSWLPSNTYYFSINRPAWSISNELFFYISFIFLAKLSVRHLSALFLILLTLVLCSAGVAWSTGFGEKVVAGSASLSHWLFYINPAFRLLEFLTGMLLFEVFRTGFRIKAADIWQAWAVVFLIATILTAKHLPDEFRYSVWFLPAIAALILSIALSEEGWLARLCSYGWVVILGEASFVLYLTHQIGRASCRER